MKSKMRIKSIIVMAIIVLAGMFFINMSLAATTGKINVETANIRETANADSKILSQLSLNQEVEIIEKSGEWYQVKYNNITGYIRQDLITANGEPVTNEKSTKNEENTTNTEKSEDNNLEKFNIAKDCKLKIIPSINATETIEVKQNEEVNVIETMNGWVCVQTQNTKGWIRKENLTKEQPKQEQENKETEVPQTKNVIKTQYVNSATVNLRKEANTNSEIITSISINTAVEVFSEANGWSNVRVAGNEGYISTALLSNTKQETTSRGITTVRKANTENTQPKQETTAPVQNTTNKAPQANNSTVPASDRGAKVVAYAKQFIGTKYTYGGTSPSTGFDCSGFTSYVFRHFGVNLPRTSGGQGSIGKAVSRNDLMPGDLVIYSGHVAIYVGGGQVIHSPRPGKTVCIVPLNQAARGYIGARRVI